MTNAERVREGLREIWNDGNWAAAERYWAPDIVFHAVIEPEPLNGIEAVRAQHYAPLVEAFPDLSLAIEDVIAQDDRVAVRWTFRGTHTGPFLGMPPTGKSFAMPVLATFRFEDGLVKEIFTIADVLGQLQQLGVVPAGPPPGT